MSRIAGGMTVLGIVLMLAVGATAAQQELMPLPGDEDQCPCFTQADVEAIPTPYMQCLIDERLTWSLRRRDETLTTNILYEQGIAGAEAKVDAEDMKGYCAYIDVDDPLHTFVSYKNLNYQQALTCREFIVNVIEANSDQCLILCTPENPCQ